MFMASDGPTNPLDDRRKAQEEDYFRKQNAEASAKMKAKQELEALGIKDDTLVEQLTKAGYGSDEARALFVVPLVEVAWADGKVQDEERKEILSLVSSRGIEEDSKAYELVQIWLTSKPTDKKFEVARSLLEPIFDQMKEKQSETAEWILESTRRVAEATGGLFGFGLNMISKEEAKVIEKISEKLK